MSFLLRVALSSDIRRLRYKMIRNDLHIHSVQSLCGLHTLLEIVEIAANKGIRTVNICDHGESSGKKMNFGVLTDKERCPKYIKSTKGVTVAVLAGIEANILDINGNSDFPSKYHNKFDLVSAGFHPSAKSLGAGKSSSNNTKALENYLKRFPLDILTHPCIATFPLEIEVVVELSYHYGFALEVSNTNLRVAKTDVNQLKNMILLAREKGAILLENSDGHSFFEIGENDKIEKLLKEMKIEGNESFLNRDDKGLEEFIVRRKAIRNNNNLYAQ